MGYGTDVKYRWGGDGPYSRIVLCGAAWQGGDSPLLLLDGEIGAAMVWTAARKDSEKGREESPEEFHTA